MPRRKERSSKAAAAPETYKPPTDHEMMLSATEHAADMATRAHPMVKKLRERIHKQMVSAAQGVRGMRARAD